MEKQETVLALTHRYAGELVASQAMCYTIDDVELSALNGNPLVEETVFWIVDGPQGSGSQASITNYSGHAYLAPALLSVPGVYSVSVYFKGEIPIPASPLTVIDERYDPSTLHREFIVTEAIDNTYLPLLRK